MNKPEEFKVMQEIIKEIPYHLYEDIGFQLSEKFSQSLFNYNSSFTGFYKLATKGEKFTFMGVNCIVK